MKYVYISSKVEKRIENLKKTDKSGLMLAKKVNSIVSELASGVVQHHLDAINSYTKYGENRIKNCRKYNLGCGFRLIIVHRGNNIFIPFLGTHDVCQRWLEKNRRMKKVVKGKGTTFPISDSSQWSYRLLDADSMDMESEAIDDEEDEGLLKVSQQELRYVFSGLIECEKKED